MSELPIAAGVQAQPSCQGQQMWVLTWFVQLPSCVTLDLRYPSLSLSFLCTPDDNGTARRGAEIFDHRMALKLPETAGTQNDAVWPEQLGTVVGGFFRSGSPLGFPCQNQVLLVLPPRGKSQSPRQGAPSGLKSGGNQGVLSFSPADDGPYSKGGKDAGGTEVALACRRQSIPGNRCLSLPLILPWRHREPSLSSATLLLCDPGPATPPL